jgi:hypothetical protein
MAEEELPELIQALSNQFDAECQRRHEMGQVKYGPVRFLEVNALEEAMAEVVDLANYARYIWIKFALMAHLDGSTDRNVAGFEEPNTPVEIDQPTDTNSNTYTSGFFNPLRRS